MTEQPLIRTEGRKKLLAIARESVEAAVRGRPLPDVECDEAELQIHAGAFVTLTTGGRLRGCLGRFTSDMPVCELVNLLAAESAAEDPRFTLDRIRADELDKLHVEISVLSPMRRVRDPLADVELGKHGIYILRGGRSGTFLPQVATEHHMDLEQFLSTCCAHKAGLPADACKDPKTEVYVYSAEVFGEE